MGVEEGIYDHHGGEHGCLRDPVSLDDRIKSLLVVFTVELHPSCISLREGIGLIASKRPGNGKDPVYTAHYHRHPVARRKMKHFVHKGKALRRRCSEDSHSGKGGGNAHGHCRVLRFYPHHDPG
ncbi:MAG: hypothetical protein C0392_08315 [Syntrophus sp. (in: bacteria)]|nr:hypothetical protein [Syntrophus sp. (in: bacteria)]